MTNEIMRLSQIGKHQGKHFEASQTLATSSVELVFIHRKQSNFSFIYMENFCSTKTHKEWKLRYFRLYIDVS